MTYTHRRVVFVVVVVVGVESGDTERVGFPEAGRSQMVGEGVEIRIKIYYFKGSVSRGRTD